MSRFAEIFNEEYDELFKDVLKSDILTSSDKMQSLFEKSIEDHNLNDSQKNLVKKLNTIYKFATLSVKYEPISLWYISTKPNLKKIVWGSNAKSINVDDKYTELSKRLKRGVEDIKDVMGYIDIQGVENTLFNFPDYYEFLAHQFKFKENTPITCFILAALSKYCRTSYHDIMYSWYLCVFFRNVEWLATTKLEVLVDNKLTTRVSKLFSLGELLTTDRIDEIIENTKVETEDNAQDSISKDNE